MKKTAVILMFLSVLTTILGFTRELVLSFYYGVTYITDVYLISLIIPQTIIAFIGAAIASIFIPMYRKIEHETKSIKMADEFTSNIINFLFVVCSVIVIVVIIFTPFFVKIFALGFEGETFDLTVKFTRITIFAIYFSCLVFLFSSYLQLKNKFVVTGLMTIPFNLTIIFALFLSVEINLYILAIGNVIAAGFQLLFLIPFIKRSGYKYAFVLKKDIYFKRLLSLAMPVMLGVSVYQVNIMVDKTIASQVITGGISILSYANKVNALVFGLFAVPIATALYPMISKMGAEKKIKELNDTVSEAFVNIMLLVIPITIGTLVLAEPIIKLLFGRGAFGNEAISMTATALIFYSFGMLGVGLREILYRTYYSLQDTKTPLFNAAIAMVLNIILNLILSRYLGLNGIALATSISAILCTVLLTIGLRKKIGDLPIKRLLITFLKVLFSSIIMGFITIYVYEFLINYFNLYTSVLVTIIIGGGVYFLLMKSLKVKEFDDVISLIKKKFSKFNKSQIFKKSS